MLAYDGYQWLRIEKHADGVVLITIDRPDKLNATNERLHWELTQIWLTVDADPEARVAVVTGAGRAFSAGGDLDMVTKNLDDPQRVFRTGEEAIAIVSNMLRLDKPVISAINGVAVGAGLAVALTADISIVAESARLTDGHTSLGVASGDHAVMLWPLYMSLAKAKYYLLTADFIDGPTADRLGLVSECVPDDRLMPRAMEIASRLADGSQLAIRWTKRALNHWLKEKAPLLELSVAMEMLNFLEGADVRAGIEAIRSKTSPSFPSTHDTGALPGLNLQSPPSDR